MATEEHGSPLPKSTDRKSAGGAYRLAAVFSALDVDKLCSYEEIGEIIGSNPQGNGRSICSRAIKIALHTYGVKIVCDINNGYKRVGFEGRCEWVQAKGESMQRLNTERLLTAAHIEQKEFDLLTDEHKQKLAEHSARVGLEIIFKEQVSKMKKLPSLERLKLPNLSHLGQVFLKTK